MDNKSFARFCHLQETRIKEDLEKYGKKVQAKDPFVNQRYVSTQALMRPYYNAIPPLPTMK